METTSAASPATFFARSAITVNVVATSSLSFLAAVAGSSRNSERNAAIKKLAGDLFKIDLIKFGLLENIEAVVYNLA